MKKYLAYGSNLHPLRIQERVPSAAPVGTVELPGWSLHFHKRSNRDGSGKCNIRESRSDDASIYGAVYTIPAEEIPKLDRIEGLGYGYEKKHLHTDEHGDVFLYLASETHIDDSLLPFEWYKSYVVEGARYHGFPEEYMDDLKQVESVRDHDEQRRRENVSLIMAMKRKLA